MKAIKDLESRIAALEEHIREMSHNSKRVIESSIKRGFKIEAQAQTLYAPLVAFCVSTIDPLKLNRVRIFHPLLSEPDVKVRALPYARACTNQGGFDDCGGSWVPPAGSSVVVVCENGDRQAPIYIGTVWHKNRGPAGALFPYPCDEFYKIWRQEGSRGAGYLLGATDGSQVYPPWDTESNNGINYDSDRDIDLDPDAQLKITYPNIYGWKTPGKHMIKMVDGDHRCNNKWSRFEIASKYNWMMFKDDWYHPAGEWANPKGVGGASGTIDSSECDQVSALLSLDVSGSEDESNNFTGQQIGSGTEEAGDSEVSCKQAPGDVAAANPYFKRQEECRPYKGAPTPQNNKCELRQSGAQIQSGSGHQMVMDDSVNQPQEKRINWQREFDFGCDNIFKGKFFLKSATGQKIGMNDSEDEPELRGQNNGIELESATGNYVRLNDHTLQGDIAGTRRGVDIGSSSGHSLRMCDEGNEQASPTRREGGRPDPKAKAAFVQMRSGYGLLFRMDDSTSQEDTRNQFIMLTASPKTTSACNGPHTLLMQLDAGGGGFVELASGGKYILASKGDSLESVGTEECGANKLMSVFGNYLLNAKGVIVTKSTTNLHVADNYIILGAGTGCGGLNAENAEGAAEEAAAAAASGQGGGPCIIPIIIAKEPKVCPFTNFIHWEKFSMTVFASE